MKKRYQAVKIEKGEKAGKKSYLFTVWLHDIYGRDGIFVDYYEAKSKRRLISLLRSDDVEVSKHVENGGELRLV